MLLNSEMHDARLKKVRIAVEMSRTDRAVDSIKQIDSSKAFPQCVKSRYIIMEFHTMQHVTDESKFVMIDEKSKFIEHTLPVVPQEFSPLF